MANRYWVGGTGNWTDYTNHWSASSGGAPGAGLPTSADDVFFDANSFTGAGQTVTYDSAGRSCLSMDWTGAANNPTFALAADFNGVRGSLTFISGMTFTPGAYTLFISAGAGVTCNITTAGKSFYNVAHWSNATGAVVYQDNVTITNVLVLAGGLVDLDENTLAVGYINNDTSGAARTFDITNATVNLTGQNGLNWSNTTGLTLSASGSTINMSRPSGVFQNFNCGGTTGGGFTFGTVNFQASSTYMNLLGSNTFTEFVVASGKEVRITSGTTQTITGDSVIGGASASKLLAVTTDSVVTFSVASDKYILAKNCTINDIVISGSGKGYYSDGSTLDAQSTGWTAGQPVAASDSLLLKITESASLDSGFALTAVQDGTHIDLSWA